MTEIEDSDSETSESASEFNKADIDRAARDIVLIERNCFYGDEPERDRLKKIREKLLNIMTEN